MSRAAPALSVPGADGTPPCAATLHAALLDAHARGDGPALVGLYAAAAAGTEGVARAFYLTHAYIFALERGDDRAPVLRAALVEIGADTP